MGMVAAAFGYLTPVQGALIQEAIDVVVILNALRALRIRPAAPQPMHSRVGEPAIQEGIKT
jgi:cation transport ATPase